MKKGIKIIFLIIGFIVGYKAFMLDSHAWEKDILAAISTLLIYPFLRENLTSFFSDPSNKISTLFIYPFLRENLTSFFSTPSNKESIMNEEKSLFSDTSDIGHHIGDYGIIGRGKSTYLFDLEPMPEGKDQIDETRKKRLDAVRMAYWEATPAEEWYSINDIIKEHIPELTDITREQQKILFMMLPSTILGEAIKWGIGDTVVRNGIYVYIRDHVNEFRNAFSLDSLSASL